jgi:hypothetical protein
MTDDIASPSPGKPDSDGKERVTVGIDRALLADADRCAAMLGLSRSGYISLLIARDVQRTLHSRRDGDDSRA